MYIYIYISYLSIENITYINVPYQMYNASSILWSMYTHMYIWNINMIISIHVYVWCENTTCIYLLQSECSVMHLLMYRIYRGAEVNGCFHVQSLIPLAGSIGIIPGFLYVMSLGAWKGLYIFKTVQAIFVICLGLLRVMWEIPRYYFETEVSYLATWRSWTEPGSWQWSWQHWFMLGCNSLTAE